MKKVLIVALLLCAANMPVVAQKNHQILNKLADSEYIETVSIGSLAMSFIKWLSDDAHELKNISSLSMYAIKDECPAAEQKKLRELMLKLGKDKDYDVLMKAKDGKEQALILARSDKKNVIREMLIVAIDNDDDAAVIRVKGRLNPEDWKKIIENTKI